MVLVKKWPFFQLFFLGHIGQENLFFDIQERKNAFPTYKTKSSKSRKIDIFPTFLFRQYRPGKCFLRYSRTKKRLSKL